MIYRITSKAREQSFLAVESRGTLVPYYCNSGCRSRATRGHGQISAAAETGIYCNLPAVRGIRCVSTLITSHVPDLGICCGLQERLAKQIVPSLTTQLSQSGIAQWITPNSAFSLAPRRNLASAVPRPFRRHARRPKADFSCLNQSACKWPRVGMQHLPQTGLGVGVVPVRRFALICFVSGSLQISPGQ